MEIHLNASKHSEYYDDYLAMSLNTFHPRPDGTNPHKLDLIKLVISGNTPFTQYNYVLISPAFSYDIQRKLHKLATNDLTPEEKATLSYAVNSTEKAVSKALLGIRSVKGTEIERRGHAKMEAAFADTLRRTLILPPGHPLAPSQISSSVVGLNHEGEFGNSNWAGINRQPYKLRPYKGKPFSEYGKKKVLVDETTMLIGHFLDQGEESTKVEAIKIAKKSRKINLAKRRQR